MSVTVLCPGPTQTEFFQNDFKHVQQADKPKVSKAEEVAKLGYHAMLEGRCVVEGVKKKTLSEKVSPRRIVSGVVDKVLRKK
ncbi:MAG: hypothetical protein Q9M28_03675 [Mariprofundaceae bacterium]|nr:hypothetical protein [Mariprofundaceae bacterium]